MSSGGPKTKSESEWQAVLSPEQFRILRQKGTERGKKRYSPSSDINFPDTPIAAGSGKYDQFFGKGVYSCAGCGTPLFTSEQKFHSHCGWPSFFDNIPGTVDRHTDTSFGMSRTEITCAACGGHLGHVFKGEGYANPSAFVLTSISSICILIRCSIADERHCVNSVSLKFSDENGKEQ
jgi:peptide-methionine (R)-S-oxide reductase